jgi:GT2 family glycosyltransferase
MPDRPIRLSVVLGTLDRLDRLKRCIDSVLAQTQTPTRVYATDAGSTDGTVEYLQSIRSPLVEPVLVGRKLGQARAYNDVFERIETPFVCWLSDDNEVVNHGLDVAVAILDAKPEIGLVGLKVRDVVGPFVSAPYIGGVSSIGVLNVNQGVLRTRVLRDVGMFSERFRDYGIDPDLTTKVLFSGHQIAYTRVVAIHHYRDWGPDKDSPAFAKQMERQRQYQALYSKKYEALTRFSLAYELKRAAWRVGRRILGLPLDGREPLLGQIPRDWHNVMSSRYISLLDGWRYRDESFHLVQQCPRRSRPPVLPVDPPREVAADA